jgi:NADH-quinone oxidoreductase subunit M
MENLLTNIIFLPLVFIIIMGLFKVPLHILRVGALSVSLMVFILVLVLTYHFDPDQTMQFITIAPWITSYGITYYIGVDAISLVLLLLISFLMPLLFIFLWNEKRKGFFYNLLFLQMGVMGVVVSLDLVLFYLFWEMMLLPIFIMIGKYGYGMRQFNAMKIIIMTVLGSMAMLFSILYLGYEYLQTTGAWSFALSDLSSLQFDPKTSIIIAGGFLLAFAIKIPLVGFHTWMAPAYSSAPTPALVILSAIMAKLGIYGIWRFGFELFEEPLLFYTPLFITFALIGVIFYAIHAIMEKDLKKMFAFSSGSHLPLIALGLIVANTYSWNGSLYLVATHALNSAGIFLMIGMLGMRLKTITIDDLGGLASVAPRFAFLFAFFALGIAGIPGTGGFVAELLIIIGAFQYNIFVGIVSATTMIAAMVFVFWMLQRTIYGKTNTVTADFKDLRVSEMFILVPIAFLILLMGVAPSLFTPLFETNLEILLTQLGGVL